ncbi:hypothetical protein [Salipiger sp. PrR002]|uniref:helix-turn-helix transcriptional regulator n=1 Tax=Salipiger sp. PrR002 TaxID=2706489 RepID=UPI0013B7E768|nr:hypothetical protein [Salipiger sp. PrR002]NDW01303.1 hypothetical protein [Salipiger sp. PrR002]
MSDETALLRAMFAASLGSAPGEGDASEGDLSGDLWPDFLGLLAQITQAGSAELRLQGVPGAGAARCWRVGADVPGPGEDTLERMRTGRVYSQVDLPLPPGAPAQAAPLRALRLRLDEGGLALLSLQRTGEDFRATDGLHLSALMPHLGPALSGWRQLVRERAHAALDRQIGAALGAGWIIFTAAGQVSAMAEGLAEQLRDAAGIGLRADGRLALPDPVAQALRQALAAAAQGGVQRLALSAAPRLDLALTREMLAGSPQLVGRLRRGLSARGLPPERLAAAFGLSRSEARLTACLCDGLSLTEAAEVLGWTPETARSTSKQIYARMGVSGQTGVVRRVLESAVWLG